MANHGRRQKRHYRSGATCCRLPFLPCLPFPPRLLFCPVWHLFPLCLFLFVFLPFAHHLLFLACLALVYLFLPVRLSPLLSVVWPVWRLFFPFRDIFFLFVILHLFLSARFGLSCSRAFGLGLLSVSLAYAYIWYAISELCPSLRLDFVLSCLCRRVWEAAASNLAVAPAPCALVLAQLVFWWNPTRHGQSWRCRRRWFEG